MMRCVLETSAPRLTAAREAGLKAPDMSASVSEIDLSDAAEVTEEQCKRGSAGAGWLCDRTRLSFVSRERQSHSRQSRCISMQGTRTVGGFGMMAELFGKIGNYADGRVSREAFESCFLELSYDVERGIQSPWCMG